MYKILHPFRRFLNRYVSSWIILAIDTVASVLVSAFAIALAITFAQSLQAAASLPVVWTLSALVGSWLGFTALGTYRNAVRHTSLLEVGRLLMAVIIKEFVLVIAIWSLPWLTPLTVCNLSLLCAILLFDFALSLGILVLLRLVIVMLFERYRAHIMAHANRLPVLIYGVDDKAVSLVKRLEGSPHYNIVGFITPEHQYDGHKLAGLEVHSFHLDDITEGATPQGANGDLLHLKQILGSDKVRGILFAREDDARREMGRLINQCVAHGVKVFMVPTIDEMVNGRLSPNAVRQVKIEDLLGRDEIKISLDQIKAAFRGKTVMVTGAAGSIGSELCRQLATFGIDNLVMFDAAETPTHNVRLEFEEKFPNLHFVPVIGDVRSRQRLDFVFSKFHPQIVFHAAAYKHVPLMEENPCEAVMANVIGSRNVADKCIEYGAEKMVMISTDKAVNPTNVMGCTKRMAEIYVQSLGSAIAAGEKQGKTKFVTTRFGNVLGSNGSVIPRFREQIEHGGPVTVTHPDITRFFMTIPEACRLVMEAATMTTGNQIFVFDMGRSVKIANMARRMIELAGFRPDRDIKIVYTGLRPGEKLYEEVLSNAENTEPTPHERIRIARVRQYPYTQAAQAVDNLEVLAREVKITDAVALLKHIIPEFKSRNSPFESLDK